MADKDRVTRAREMIREEVDGLERKLLKEYPGAPETRRHSSDYQAGKIDGLKQTLDLLGEGK